MCPTNPTRSLDWHRLDRATYMWPFDKLYTYSAGCCMNVEGVLVPAWNRLKPCQCFDQDSVVLFSVKIIQQILYVCTIHVLAQHGSTAFRMCTVVHFYVLNGVASSLSSVASTLTAVAQQLLVFIPFHWPLLPPTAVCQSPLPGPQ